MKKDLVEIIMSVYAKNNCLWHEEETRKQLMRCTVKELEEEILYLIKREER